MAVADARAARERKQKIFVIVGAVVLLGLLAFQLPRLLGGSSPSPSASPTVETTTTPGAETSPKPSSPAPASLADSSRRLAPAPGKLESFTLFTRKDPFVQQIVAPSPTAGSPASTEGKQSKTKEPASKGFTVGGGPTAAVTVISVNGARQALVPGAAFPTANPVFVLVAEQQTAETVVIGIAGGGYASGAKTTKLKVGKPLVLVNTTTGARYRLVLVAVGTGEQSPASAETPSGPTTP
jgi:hypothetical protein